MGNIVDRWNTAYFYNRLSPGAVAALNGLIEASADAQALADRVFRLMRVARFDPADLTSLTAWVIGYGAPRAVPSAWDGAVPPITMIGRHQKLDDYLARNPWHRPTDEPVLVDLGCGFPPFTAVDSAAKLTGWRIIGVDPSFSRYLVYDDRGDYACFDDEEHLRYYQTSNIVPDTAVTQAHFRRLLHHLLPLLADDNTGELGEVEHHGARLIRDPLRRYEDDKLVLIQGEIGSCNIEDSVDVIRCMNVFMYFDHTFRKRALKWACGVLKPGGLFICGSNWKLSTSSRYTVYQEQRGHLVAREFALSIDNIRPVALAPWYALHDDNFENLCNAEAVGIIRGDGGFRRRFDVRLDEMLVRAGVCARGADGYLAGAAEEARLGNFEERSADLVEQLDCEGFVADAVSVLRRAGRDAWRNGVGHIAMRPFQPHPLAPSAVL